MLLKQLHTKFRKPSSDRLPRLILCQMQTLGGGSRCILRGCSMLKPASFSKGFPILWHVGAKFALPMVATKFVQVAPWARLRLAYVEAPHSSVWVIIGEEASKAHYIFLKVRWWWITMPVAAICQPKFEGYFTDNYNASSMSSCDGYVHLTSRLVDIFWQSFCHVPRVEKTRLLSWPRIRRPPPWSLWICIRLSA